LDRHGHRASLVAALADTLHHHLRWCCAGSVGGACSVPFGRTGARGLLGGRAAPHRRFQAARTELESGGGACRG